MEGADLVPCVGGPPGASFGFYLREVFQKGGRPPRCFFWVFA